MQITLLHAVAFSLAWLHKGVLSRGRPSLICPETGIRVGMEQSDSPENLVGYQQAHGSNAVTAIAGERCVVHRSTGRNGWRTVSGRRGSG
jgi:hypothetical protein